MGCNPGQAVGLLQLGRLQGAGNGLQGLLIKALLGLPSHQLLLHARGALGVVLVGEVGREGGGGGAQGLWGWVGGECQSMG